MKDLYIMDLKNQIKKLSFIENHMEITIINNKITKILYHSHHVRSYVHSNYAIKINSEKLEIKMDLDDNLFRQSDNNSIYMLNDWCRSHHGWCLMANDKFNSNFKLVKCKHLTLTCITYDPGYENLPESLETIVINGFSNNLLNILIQTLCKIKLPNLNKLIFCFDSKSNNSENIINSYL